MRTPDIDGEDIGMRYTKDHKAETRARVVETAGRILQRDGLDGVGVAGLMGEAGLTKGGFYAHFASREALVAEAVAAGMTRSAANTRRAASEASMHERSMLEGIVETYLSPPHVAARDTGCTIGSLLADLARAPASIRTAATGGAADLVTAIEEALPETLGRERRPRAQAILATMIGSLQLARLEEDEAARDAILASGRDAAYRIAGR